MKANRQSNFNHLMILCAITLSFMLGGCASMKPSALNHDVNTIDVSKESIALLAIKVANDYKPSYQPNIKYIFVHNNDKENGEKYSFKIDEKFNEVEDSFNEYLISFQLPAGTYKLKTLLAQSGIFPVIGTFSIPIYSTFSIQSEKIIYLGHIEATIKEKTEEKELRAGSVFPLIDQAVTGASGGTFVVKITDSFENDIKLFKKDYPYLSQHQIDNLTLPQWTQPTEEDMQ